MSDQENAIINTLRYYEATNAIIFCATRIAVNHMTSRLTNRGISAVALSGELSQNERNMALQAMRTSKARVCVATDVAARGLDLPNLDLVIHADIPRTSDTLLHRSGRTGRAGRKGVCAVLVPQNRSRIAERLFGQANVKPIWASPPSREEILKEDKKRIVENKILEDPITDEEQELVNELISKNSIEQLAAAYYRLIGKDLSAPEDLRNPSDKIEGRTKGNGFQNSIWFELSVGKDDTAEPRWLVAMLCKAGNLSKRDIGSIKIQPKVTFIEISEETSSTLKELAANKKPIERHIMVRLLEKPPENFTSNRSNPNRSRKGGRNQDFKRPKEENTRHFKGKRKSERWKKTEKRKTKFSPFADNFVEKDFSVDNLVSVNSEPLSRRKKQKKNFASLDTNFKHKKKSGTLKIKKIQETSKKTTVNKRAKKKEN
jgi:ATP-dependent RNA helicase DeaD